MRRQEEPYLTGNLTAMIDVVFQLIIFFVCTVALQEKAVDDSIRLSMAPDGEPVKGKDPREVTIDVDRGGAIKVAHERVSQAFLTTILIKAVADCGGPNNVPVIIRGDLKSLHGDGVQPALDACSRAGIIQVRFAALVESAKQQSD